MPRGQHRRVSTPPVPGSDPHPQQTARDAELASEDSPAAWGDAPKAPETENDGRLVRERPPHWG